MTPAHFKSIRRELGLSQRAAARFLGIGFRTLQRYESGEYVVPRVLELLGSILHTRVIPLVTAPSSHGRKASRTRP
jgi:transcriptional regulator with XRE-family HTH domain